MSRPSSYHDSAYASANDPFPDSLSLPLFNAHPGLQPPSATTHRSSSEYPRAPPLSTSHQQRHSFHQSPISPYPTSQRDASPRGSGPPPPSQNMASAIPYASVPYPQSAHPMSGHQEELMPPPSSFASLARSASLGTRKKTYASDDVESGMGMMDVRDSNGDSWGGYGAPGPPTQQYPLASPRSLTNPAASSSRGYAFNNNNQMNPPPVPSHIYPRPDPARVNSDGSSSSRHEYAQGPSSSMSNPYIPQQNPATSDQTQWTERRHASASMSAASTSYHSPASEQLSPFMQAEPRFSPAQQSLHLSPSVQSSVPPSPRESQGQWNAAYHPPPPQSPSTSNGPPPTVRSHSHQLYPSSQPVTPGRPVFTGPPRSTPSREGRSPSRDSAMRGLREIRDASDLRPYINHNPSGRRADPMAPGKFLSPLKCLTATLPQTYTLCNSSFRYETTDNPRRVLTKPSKPVHNDGADNEDWDYILFVNDVLGGDNGGDRYLILDVLGQGTFGQVVKCQNMRTHAICAVKVVKNKPAYLNQSKMEVAILELLNKEWDPNDQRHILRMLESFTHKSHLCLVFECLSSNLYELIKQNQFKGLSTQLVKVFTQQLLDCLAVLKEARLIHCDLKPENILLKSLQSPQIKVIDFGSACHEMQTVYTYIQSRFYRSPEVLLGLPYSTAIDMWSLGCIVVELFLGLPLFPGTSEYNQVSRIVDMLGNPPQHLLEVGKQTHEFFNCVGVDGQGRKQYQLKSMEQYASEHRTQEQPSKQYFKQTKLQDIIMEYPISKKNPKASDTEKEMANRRAFVNFVEGLLNMDPIKRWSPNQAAKHPFITGEKYTGPFEPTLPSKRTPAIPETPVSASTPKKYGGLVQNPSSQRQQRVYSDAASYNQQLAQHQSYTAQVQNANNAPRPGPFAPGYDMAQSQQAYQQRIPSQSHALQQQRPPQWTQGQMAPPQQNYQPRIPSSGHLASSASHSQLRTQSQVLAVPTNPPPNSYYPQSRNRANTINQMDAIPPALARLTNLGAPDPSGVGRSTLTPVMNRDEAMREWERRNNPAGHAKRASMQSSSYPQLEYLQEQAELAATGGQNWMMPGQYGSLSGGLPSQGQYGHSQGHRSHHSGSGSGTYQKQPHIGITANDYRARPSASEYDPPVSSHSNTPYLPTYPPAAATSNPGSAQPGQQNFDVFDMRGEGLGSMYTPLQPSQVGYGANQGGHGSRASYSGPYGNGQPQQVRGNNPFNGQGGPGSSSPGYNSGGRRYQGA